VHPQLDESVLGFHQPQKFPSPQSWAFFAEFLGMLPVCWRWGSMVDVGFGLAPFEVPQGLQGREERLCQPSHMA
jgi:hypothetical protein